MCVRSASVSRETAARCGFAIPNASCAPVSLELHRRDIWIDRFYVRSHLRTCFASNRHCGDILSGDGWGAWVSQGNLESRSDSSVPLRQSIGIHLRRDVNWQRELHVAGALLTLSSPSRLEVGAGSSMLRQNLWSWLDVGSVMAAWRKQKDQHDVAGVVTGVVIRFYR